MGEKKTSEPFFLMAAVGNFFPPKIGESRGVDVLLICNTPKAGFG